MSINENEKAILLLSARESIHSLLDNDVVLSEIDNNVYPGLSERGAGAFVTLLNQGKLRGCIGYLSSTNTLLETVQDAAQQAALNDPRFSPLTIDELYNVDLEISVLTPALAIKSYGEINLGEHGLVLDEYPYHSVLLPQVAIEHNFTIEQFLSALCEKAGLDKYAWDKTFLNIKTFTAVVFSEVGKRKITYERL
ncbi:MAG TPA: AmmeMemoRadiSam system protein A [Ignavibacteriaceae bacterium]|nr:AmmeMemoRadiSam system protein A [Ignavibacteriaceae bacterium]